MKSRKSIFVLILILLILSTTVIVIAQTITTLSVEDKTALQNSTNFSVPIFLENNESIAGFQFNVDYSTELILKDIELTERLSDFNRSIEINSSTPGTIKIAALVENEIASGNGAILNLIFDVDENALPGEYEMPLVYVVVGNIGAESVEKDVINGTFTILADSDYDQIPNINDSCPSIFGCELHSGCNFGLKEWLPPISLEEEFELQQGATLPLKFNVTDCSGDFYIDNGVIVNVINESISFYKEYNASGEGNDFVRINETESHYILNIHTNQLNMSLGTYDGKVEFSNGNHAEVAFELIQNGKGKGKKK
jgi:hypothetical protein